MENTTRWDQANSTDLVVNLTSFENRSDDSLWRVSCWNSLHGPHSECSWYNGSDNATSLQPPAQEESKIYWALVLVILPFLAVFGNILVILSVYRERSLQSATNYFIVSLAFADLLVAAVVMPFAVYVLVNIDWELSDTLCDFYIAVDVTCSTASIFNLVAISIDRFIAVTQPIKYSKHKNKKRVALTIGIVWVVSAAIGSPIVLGLNTSSERVPQLCIFYNSDFIIYSSLSSFYIPCFVMVFLYYRIFKAIHERAKKNVGSKRSYPSRDSKSALVIENTSQTHRYQQDTPLNLGAKGASGVGKLQAVNAESDPVTNTGSGSQIEDDEDEVTEANVDRSPDAEESGAPSEKPAEFVMSTVQDSVIAEEVVAPNGNNDSGYAASNVEETQFCVQNPPVDSPLRARGAFGKNGTAGQRGTSQTTSKKKTRFNLGKKHKSSRKKREKASAKRERKATKTLAIVLGVFLFCWVPFFTCNIMDAICIKLKSSDCRPGMVAFLLTTWLGYMNSCVNPVIYTIFNPEFRKAFKKIIMQPCK